ncbi:unnamed protein product [Durusdinium trenchii]|uniref:Uncharacterized protein n=1 Tax=Durusdinium trenchii TaxID=1381693 RepID=A0ABP0M1J8_9DINO
MEPARSLDSDQIGSVRVSPGRIFMVDLHHESRSIAWLLGVFLRRPPMLQAVVLARDVGANSCDSLTIGPRGDCQMDVWHGECQTAKGEGEPKRLSTLCCGCHS